MTNVCIIGAGPSGLAAAKSAMDIGLTPYILEKGETVGGLWRPKTGYVWDNMETNLSNYNMDIGLAPLDKTPRLLHNSEVHSYLKKFSEKYDLNKNIQLNAKVIKVGELPNQQWHVEWIQNDELKHKDFSFLIVASGFFAKAVFPQINGLEKFKGQILHSKDYKNAQAFLGKKVVVIGNSFSGTEIAADLAKSVQVVHVARKSVCFFNPYVTQNGHNIPWDFYLCRAKKTSVSKEPIIFTRNYKSLLEEGRIDYKLGHITEITNTNVVLNDDQKIEADVLIFCTGYTPDLSFLSDSVKETIEYDPNDTFLATTLDKGFWHPNLPTLGFIGMWKGPFWATLKLQSQALCAIFADKVNYSHAEAQKGLAEIRKLRAEKPTLFPFPKTIEYTDQFGQMISATPNVNRLKKSNPDLYHLVEEGPFSVNQYALEGLYAKPKQAIKILNQLKEVTYA